MMETEDQMANEEGKGGSKNSQSFAIVPWDVVNNEIQAQKFSVKERYRALEASLSKEEYEKLTEEQLGKEAEKLKPDIFPTWLIERTDFQYVFPQFAKFSMDELSLVAFAMSKDLKQRTSFDIDKTVNFMVQIQELKHLPKPLCQTLTKSVRLGRYQPGSPIYQAGETAQMFYVLLHGKVEVYNKSKSIVHTIHPGQAFGEAALSGQLEEKYTMNATAVGGGDLERRGSLESICSSASRKSSKNLLAGGQGTTGNQTVPSFFNGIRGEVILLELGAQDYRATSKLYFQTQTHHISKFLQTHVTLFSKWSKHRVNQVSPLLHQRSFKPGEKIQRIGEPAKEFYFVFSGTCEVQREIVKTRRNRWPQRGQEELRDTPRGQNKYLKKILTHEVREARTTKSVQLAELGPGDYFGEESIIGYEKRRTTVVARGVTEVLVLPKQHARKMFTAKVIEELRQKHQNLFTSEEDILQKDERDHNLKLQYRHLRMTAFGPDYRKRLESSTRDLRSGLSSSALNKSKSSVLFPGSSSRSTLVPRSLQSQSSSLLPPI